VPSLQTSQTSQTSTLIRSDSDLVVREKITDNDETYETTPRGREPDTQGFKQHPSRMPPVDGVPAKMGAGPSGARNESVQGFRAHPSLAAQ